MPAVQQEPSALWAEPHLRLRAMPVLQERSPPLVKVAVLAAQLARSALVGPRSVQHALRAHTTLHRDRVHVQLVLLVLSAPLLAPAWLPCACPARAATTAVLVRRCAVGVQLDGSLRCLARVCV